MRKILLLILLFSFLLGCSCSFKNKNDTNPDAWFYIAENDTVFFDFGNEKLEVDTFEFVEGFVFYHKSQSDSSYFRINTISPWTRYECCSNDSIYNILSAADKYNIVERRGILATGDLYWRSLTFLDFEVVYNYCPADKLEQYDKTLDSVYEQYRENKRHSSSTTDE